MSKQVAFDRTAREAIKNGVEKMAWAVRPTLGPRGRTVILDKSWGAPNVTKDGASVAEEIELMDPYENMGAQMLKEAASRTSDQAGDGTTTSTVLAEALYMKGLRYVTAGVSVVSIARGIQDAAKAVAEELTRRAEEVTVKETDRLSQIGQIASGGNEAVGKMLGEAFSKVGKDGAITIEEGKGIDTEVRIVEGMQFDRGFLSPHFVTDRTSVESILDNPLILIHEDKLSSVTPLIPLLEKVSEQKRSLLIIAEDVDGEALSMLVVNKLRGILRTCAVKAPGYGDRRKAMLEDIAILTGGKAIYKDLGIDLEKIVLEDLGTAKRVKVDADFTTIVEGAGSESAVEARCAQIRREFEQSDSDYDREKLQERLSRMAEGVAQIDVGGATETVLKERKSRVEDALHSVRAALEEGVIPGGGVSYLHAREVLKDLKLKGDSASGAKIVYDALEAPFRLLVSNSGAEPSVTMKKVLSEGEDFGFDAENLKVCNLKEAGIFDAVKVARHALLNAASVTSCLLQTECLISELPEQEESLGAQEPGAAPMY
ncbi:MAG: chaperonin GroEL [Planctomycetota bacterium]|jgi:chaperonin GroEL|nr:chaperonin GroEL [Planctomycetota bacterium]